MIKNLFLLIVFFYSFSSMANPSKIIEKPNYSKIANFLESHPEVDSVEKLLPFLDSKYRSHFTLAFNPESTFQDGSYLNPRVLMFGEDAKFIMTFNGDPSQKGFDVLETMEFNEKEKSFTLRKIDFPFNRSKVEPNPPLCLSCHKSDPRPNWDHYSNWPGFYGQFDNKLGAFPYSLMIDPSSGDSIPASQYDLGGKIIDTYDKFLEFKKYAKTHDRYKHLLKLEKFLPSEGKRNERGRGGPNSVFTELLAHLNFQRVTRIVRALPYYNDIKYALAVSFRNMNNLKLFFPNDYNFPEAKRETVYSDKETLDILFGAFGENNLQNTFFTNFNSGPGNAFTTPYDYESLFKYYFTKDDPELSRYFIYKSYQKVKVSGHFLQFHSGELKPGVLTNGSYPLGHIKKYLKK